jgi:hypothetical protein
MRTSKVKVTEVTPSCRVAVGLYASLRVRPAAGCCLSSVEYYPNNRCSTVTDYCVARLARASSSSLVTGYRPPVTFLSYHDDAVIDEYTRLCELRSFPVQASCFPLDSTHSHSAIISNKLLTRALCLRPLWAMHLPRPRTLNQSWMPH